MTAANDHDNCTIVVDLKFTTTIATGINAAATLAAATGGRVLGLVVQEESMVNLANLPFASATIDSSGKARTFSREQMINAFEQQARMSKKLLSDCAARAKIRWSFSYDKGTSHSSRREAINPGDFLVLNASEYHYGTHRLLEEIHSCPAGTRGVVAIHSPLVTSSATHRHLPGASKAPVVAIDDGDESGRDTVALAARIASVTNNALVLMVIASDDDTASRIVQRARKLVPAHLDIRMHRYLPGASQAILAALAQAAPGYVVADVDGQPFVDSEIAADLVRAARAPVVLLRGVTTSVTTSVTAGNGAED